MKNLIFVVFAAVLVFALWSIRPVGADHDMVYAPCDPEDTRPLDEQVYFLDYQSGEALRFDDPWWSERANAYTNWGHQCLLGMTGVWQAAPILPLPHPPTHTVESRDATTTTTTATVAPTTTTTTTVAPTTTTTTVVPTTTTAPPPTTTGAPVADLGDGYSLPDGYDLWAAEYAGYPFEQTILLLEQRYPPNIAGRYYFPLSVAVEYLRRGGMVAGLDNLWESG